MMVLVMVMKFYVIACSCYWHCIGYFIHPLALCRLHFSALLSCLKLFYNHCDAFGFDLPKKSRWNLGGLAGV